MGQEGPHNDDNDVPIATLPSPRAPPLTGNPLQVDNWADYIPTTDHVKFFRSREWGKTCMGELKTWGIALRLQVFMVLADSRAACLYWYILLLTRPNPSPAGQIESTLFPYPHALVPLP
jgi:hypothetical protein